MAKVALGLVAVALIRFMPTEEYAAFTLVVSVATLAAQALASGFNRIYIVGYERFALQKREESFLGLQFGLILAGGVVALPLAAGFRGLYWAVVALALSMLLSEFSKTYYQRELRFNHYSAIEVARAAAQALAIMGLIAVYGQSLGAAAVLSVQTVVLVVAFLVALGPILVWGRFAQLRTAVSLCSTILGGPYAFLFAYFAVLSAFSQTDVIMLKLLADDGQLASYGAALRYYGLLLLALGAVHTVLLPAIQRADKAAELNRLYAEHFRRVVLFVPAVFLAAWVAQWVLPWVDQGRYPEAVPTFRVLAASAVVSFAFSPYVNLLMKLERFRVLFLLIVVGLGISVGLNMLLIPRFGAIGAAVATLVASACVNVPIYFECRRFKPKQA